jgi:starch phosphorylase
MLGCSPVNDRPPERNDGTRDIARAIHDLAERLPAPLLPLAQLAFNYLWSWLPGGSSVFEQIDPGLWRRGGCNPRALLEATPPHRFAQLAIDSDYVGRVAGLAAELERQLAAPARPRLEAARPVAYFCSEFAAHGSLPLYGGGLGVLAGDLLKAASDLAVPLVGMGLLYRQGYFHQRLDLSGWQHEYWTTTAFERLPLVRVTDVHSVPLAVDIDLRGRRVRIQVWRVDLGRVALYLLDTDRDDNHPIDRFITARLYIGDRHTRLAQYAVLGIGGARMLDMLGVEPSLIHLNEGHAALGGFERIHRLLVAGSSLDDALAAVRGSTVFTTHTPVAAGNEWYAVDEIEPVLGQFAADIGIPRALFYDLGRFTPGDPGEPVSITPLALRTSRAAIGVSRRHGIVARGMWQRLWPERAVDEVPIGHVTNGVHTTTWMALAMQALLDRHLPGDWRIRVADADLWQRLRTIPNEELWATRATLRRRLVERVREKSVHDRLSRGEAPDYVEAAATTFDPDALTIGFARRVATYKRLHLLVRQLDWGLRLLADTRRPIQLVIAGKAHPSDDDAKRTLQSLMATRHQPGVASRITFLEDYDLHVAALIVSGVDVWLNLPRPPLEASGTSGMKVVLNGGLNLSVLDGWWEEACAGDNGWGITTPDTHPDAQDDHDARRLFEIMEGEVIPLFYDRDPRGVPHHWVERIKASMSGLVPRFSAARMLEDYVRQLYAPAA